MTVFDTDVLIDVSRGDATASEVMLRYEREGPLAISAITEMELIVGCRDKSELHKLDAFLNRRRIRSLPVAVAVSDEAARLMRAFTLSHGLLIPDALIAATALTHDLDFVSKNQRDYRFIPGLKLHPYP